MASLAQGDPLRETRALARLTWQGIGVGRLKLEPTGVAKALGYGLGKSGGPRLFYRPLLAKPDRALQGHHPALVRATGKQRFVGQGDTSRWQADRVGRKRSDAGSARVHSALAPRDPSDLRTISSPPKDASRSCQQTMACWAIVLFETTFRSLVPLCLAHPGSLRFWPTGGHPYRKG